MAGIVALGVWLYFAELMALPYLIGCVLFAFSIFPAAENAVQRIVAPDRHGELLDRIEGVFR